MTEPLTRSLGPSVATQANQAGAVDLKYQQSLIAYASALAKLGPSWSATPLAPYPPAGDTSYPPFPQTNPTLVLTQSSVNAQQRAEPGRVTQGLLDQKRARRPKFNAYFAIGVACLAGYLVIRRRA